MGRHHAVSLGEYQNNPAVFFDLKPTSLPKRIPCRRSVAPDDPAWQRRQRWNQELQRTLAGCDFLIMGVLTEAGPGVLADQIGTLLYRLRRPRPAANLRRRAA